MSVPVDLDKLPTLGIPDMDRIHKELAELLEQLTCADEPTFRTLFTRLLQHTEIHFAAENRSMQQSGFPALREHRDEHARVLGELTRLHAKVSAGALMLARAYVRDGLPEWFHLHLLTMDSALAAHILSRQGPGPALQVP